MRLNTKALIFPEKEPERGSASSSSSSARSRTARATVYMRSLWSGFKLSPSSVNMPHRVREGA
ncbi:hypothetical protein EYF80_006373 [Liparis tanakae]|uniref:Uncharacterized protein n=1 Tax=Liparis tanakae TaxID=230148 RepID=A0A4Z2J1J7_9TELE|nr:hypothetical protein EYF80_006373 [Liparis tanakae]